MPEIDAVLTMKTIATAVSIGVLIPILEMASTSIDRSMFY
jgi:hypothetical protein